MLCGTALLPFFYKCFIDERYQDSMVLVPVLLLGTIYLSVSQFINGILIADMKTVSAGVSTIISAGVNIIINILFLHKCGVFIAALSTCISYLIMLLLRMFMIREIVTRDILIKLCMYSFVQMGYTVLLKLHYSNFNLFLFVFSAILAFLLNRKEIERFVHKRL